MKKNIVALMIGVVVIGLLVLMVKASNPAVFSGMDKLFKVTVWLLFFVAPFLLGLFYNIALVQNQLELSGVVIVFLWLVGLLVYAFALPVIGISIDNAMGTELFKSEKPQELALGIIGVTTYLATGFLVLIGSDL